MLREHLWFMFLLFYNLTWLNPHYLIPIKNMWKYLKAEINRNVNF